MNKIIANIIPYLGAIIYYIVKYYVLYPKSYSDIEIIGFIVTLGASITMWAYFVFSLIQDISETDNEEYTEMSGMQSERFHYMRNRIRYLKEYLISICIAAVGIIIFTFGK